MNLEVDIKKKLKEFTLNVHFSWDAGTLGLMGSSGSGKSMTLKCIAGIEAPDTGRIVLNDKVLFDSTQKINLAPQQRHVGYLFQSYALFPNMDVAENIECGLRAQGMAQAQRLSVVRQLLEKFQLQGLEHRYPRQLSGGQKQRVALARLLAIEPDLILLDEPFSALDADLKEKLQNQLQSLLADYGGTAILVSHDSAEVAKLSSRCLRIRQGSLEQTELTEDYEGGK